MQAYKRHIGNRYGWNLTARYIGGVLRGAPMPNQNPIVSNPDGKFDYDRYKTFAVDDARQARINALYCLEMLRERDRQSIEVARSWAGMVAFWHEQAKVRGWWLP